MSETMKNRMGMSYELIAVDPNKTMIKLGDKNIVVNRPLKTIASSWYDWTRLGLMVQHAFQYLSTDEREFLMTGLTPVEWDELFHKEGEEK